MAIYLKSLLQYSTVWIGLLCFLFISCNNPAAPKPIFSKDNWLLGTWKHQDGSTMLLEQWKKIDQYSFQGTGIFMKGSDTLSQEVLALKLIDKQWHYCSKVSNQNEGKSICFKLIEQTEQHLIFENQQHDFPQIIHYTQPTKDSLIAKIAGTKKGQFKEVTFSFQRLD